MLIKNAVDTEWTVLKMCRGKLEVYQWWKEFVSTILENQNCKQIRKNIKPNKKQKVYIYKTVENFSPKDWKFRVETIIKLDAETTIEVYSPKDWKFRVGTPIKFTVETNELKLKR